MPDVRRAGFVTDHGIVLGRYKGRVLMDDGNGHVGIFGHTESGKDSGHNFPTTALWRGSLLIADTKATDTYPLGENYGICAPGRARLGPVYRFAPAQQGSCCLNVLDAVRWGKAEEFDDVSFILRSMLLPAHHERQRSQEANFWGGMGLQILRATTLYAGNFPLPGEGHYAVPYASFPRVLRFMQPRHHCLMALQQCRHPLIVPVADELVAIEKRAPRQFEGMWSQTLLALDIYQSPMIARHTSHSDFSLLDLQAAATPITLYLSARSSGELAHLANIFRPILEQALSQLKNARLSQRWRLLCLLNEFPAFGYMPSLEKDIADVRAHGIRLMIPVQTPNQLFGLYGHDTPLWGNMVTKVFHKLADDEFAARLSKAIGEEDIEYESRHRSTSSGRTTRGTATHRLRRPLMPLSALLGLPPAWEIIWSTACTHMILADKVNYWTDQEFQPYRERERRERCQHDRQGFLPA